MSDPVFDGEVLVSFRRKAYACFLVGVFCHSLCLSLFPLLLSVGWFCMIMLYNKV